MNPEHGVLVQPISINIDNYDGLAGLNISLRVLMPTADLIPLVTGRCNDFMNDPADSVRDSMNLLIDIRMIRKAGNAVTERKPCSR